MGASGRPADVEREVMDALEGLASSHPTVDLTCSAERRAVAQAVVRTLGLTVRWGVHHTLYPAVDPLYVSVVDEADQAVSDRMDAELLASSTSDGEPVWQWVAPWRRLDGDPAVARSVRV